MLNRPKNKKKRSKQIQRLRVQSLDALSAVEEASTEVERAAALEACREALHSLLLGTIPKKAFEEMAAEYPSLLQPSLFSTPLRSLAE
jgi:hypothetical protein